MNIKRKHHFVSQFYLRNWLSGNNKLHVWDGQGKVFCVGTENIGFKTDFYKIVKLKEKQIIFFQNFIKKYKYEDLSTYKLIIQPILETERMFENANKIINILGVDRDETNKDSFKEIDRLEKEFRHNTIEDKFSIDEASFSKILNKIITGNNELNLTLKDYDVIVHFIAFQLSKTPKKLERITKYDNNDSIDEIMRNYDFTDKEYHTYTLYAILCLTEKIYLASLSRLDKINIYYSISPDINFITSDDPCFNQKMEEKKLHIQIPISPKVMIELIENNDENKTEMLKYYNHNKDYPELISLSDTLINFYDITKDEIKILNDKILNNRHQFIYAYCKGDIEKLKM